VGASRALARVWLGDQYLSILKRASRPKVLIYGAGTTGRQLAAAMANSHEMQVAGFLDDDDRLHGHVLNGQPIYNPADLDNLATTLNISDVLLAMPSLSRKRRNEILSQIRSAHVAVRTLPSVTDLAQGKISISDLRELDIDDLLGREPVTPNHILLVKNIVGKVVLVTGAGGSIGSELCRQILAVNPAKLLLIEQSEFALYAIHQELEEKLAGLDGATPPVLVPPCWLRCRTKNACAKSCPHGTRTRSTTPRPTSTCHWWSTTRPQASRTTCWARCALRRLPQKTA